MILSVDPGSPVPVFEQLRAQIRRLVVAGTLAPGSALPPIRRLAADLGLARGTVNRAYDALVRDGLVETRGRHGTMVLARHRGGGGTGELAEAAGALAVVVRQLGMSDDAAHGALALALRRLDRPAGST